MPTGTSYMWTQGPLKASQRTFKARYRKHEKMVTTTANWYARYVDTKATPSRIADNELENYRHSKRFPSTSNRRQGQNNDTMKVEAY